MCFRTNDKNKSGTKTRTWFGSWFFSNRVWTAWLLIQVSYVGWLLWWMCLALSGFVDTQSNRIRGLGNQREIRPDELHSINEHSVELCMLVVLSSNIFSITTKSEDSVIIKCMTTTSGQKLTHCHRMLICSRTGHSHYGRPPFSIAWNVSQFMDVKIWSSR